MKNSLEALFGQEPVCNQYVSTLKINAQNNFLQDLTDGSIVKQKSFYRENPKAGRLILYADAFEVDNPLRSGRKKHKMHAIYYILANLETWSRSNVDQIQLVLLCRENDLKKFGIGIVYARLIADLKQLEKEGIHVDLGLLPVVVFAICADNLGSHEIGGFTENFSKSEFFCRYCQISRETFHHSPYVIGDIRKAENYNTAAASGTKGVKTASVFNGLQNFHVCQPDLPPCLGHDLFEGVVAQDLAIFILYFVRNNRFTYAMLNHKIEKMKFLGSDALSKPSIISKVVKKKLGGQATQNWCMLRLFPILVVNWIKKSDDGVWQLLLQLREIVELVVSPKLSRDDVAYLKCQIEDMCALGKRCFHNSSCYHNIIIYCIMLI